MYDWIEHLHEAAAVIMRLGCHALLVYVADGVPTITLQFCYPCWKVPVQSSNQLVERSSLLYVPHFCHHLLCQNTSRVQEFIINCTSV